MNWREQLANAVAEILKDTTLDKGQVKGKIDSLIDAIHEDNEPTETPAEGGDAAPAADDLPQPAEAMESVRLAYPNDPNVAVLLEQAGRQIKGDKLKAVKQWAKDKGVPEDRLTEGVLESIAALDEPLRENLLIPLKIQAGVKAPESTPVLPTKVNPAPKPPAKKPDAESPPVKDLMSVWG